MKKLPKKVKVGPVVYKVLFEPGLFTESKYGKLMRPQGEIHLLPNLPVELQWSTLLHEVTHELLEQAGFEQSEQVADIIGYGMAAFIQDNLEK